MNRFIMAWVMAGAVISTSSLLASPNSYELRLRSRAYLKKVIIPEFKKNKILKDACKKANKDRATWQKYTEVWKEWTREDAKKAPESYTKAEFLWTIAKDTHFRNTYTSSEASKFLTNYQKQSSGVIGEIFIVDKHGGNVALSRPTTDWFQGDEDKFIKPVTTNTLYISPVEKDSSSQSSGSHGSFTIKDQGETICVAIFLIAPQKIPKEMSDY